MTLPFPPRRSHLTAFWLILHLVTFVAAGLLALGLGLTKSGLVLAALLAGTLALGLIQRDAPLFLYRAWNKAAKVGSRVGQWWVLAVTYYVVLSVVGRGGSRLDLGFSSGSMWKPYAAGNGTAEPRMGWARRLAREARGQDRSWWIGVLPLLVILSLVTPAIKDEDVPANIYTLY